MEIDAPIPSASGIVGAIDLDVTLRGVTGTITLIPDLRSGNGWRVGGPTPDKWIEACLFDILDDDEIPGLAYQATAAVEFHAWHHTRTRVAGGVLCVK